MGYLMAGKTCQEIPAEERSEDESDERSEHDGDSYGRQPSLPIWPVPLNSINDVEAVLNRRESNRSGPQRGDQTKGELPGGRSCRGLIESLQNSPQGRRRDHDRQVCEKTVIDLGSGAGSQAKDRSGHEEGGKERKEKEKAQFGGPAQQVVGEKGLPGIPSDDTGGHTFEIPERTQGRAGDVAPDRLTGVGKSFVWRACRSGGRRSAAAPVAPGAVCQRI